MAKLYSEVVTNRTVRRGSDVHRLGDTWVMAHVQNWEHQLTVYLNDEGECYAVIRDLRGVKSRILYEGPIAEALEPPKPVAVSQPAEVTALEVDVQQFLKESA